MQSGAWLPIAVALPLAATLLLPLLRGRIGLLLSLVPLGVLLLALPGFTGRETAQWSVPWIPELGIDLAFRIDPLSRTFVLLIAVVGAAVFPYAGAYMGNDRQFFATLVGFMGAMLGIVLADDLVLMFLFWEGTSVTSFLLIAHDRQRPAARRAAQQAFLVTFVGGLALMGGAALVGSAGGTTRLSALPDVLRGSPLYLGIVLCVLIAAFTKSAQAPFHFWLPNAMEAPTPVSAYLHSATMVQAGVYLLARMDPFLGGTTIWTNALTYIGCATALLGAALSLRQRDLKKLLAYSTVGALGILVAAIGQRAWVAFFAFFVAHGLFKATMFLVAGRLGHVSRDAYALRGMARVMPMNAIAGVLGALSMAALPPFLGYIGKEELLHGGSPVLVWTTVVYGAASAAVAFIVGVRPLLGTSDHERVPSTAEDLAPWLTGGLGLLLIPFLAPALDKQVTFVAPGVLSLVAWAGAAVLVLAWERGSGKAGASRLTLDGVYDWIRATGGRVASWLVRRLQHGYLNGYIRTVFATLTILVAFGVARALPSAAPQHLDAPTFYEAGIAIAMVVGAVAAVLSPSRLGAVAALGIVGYGVAMVYVRFGAPDLAMTQIAVETLTLILFVFTFYYLPRTPQRRNPGPRLRDGLIAAGVGVTMTALTVIASGIPNDGKLAREFSTRALPEGKGHNVVNVILVDFRGFDTLGEITVLSIAGIGVFALLRMPRKGGGPSAPSS